VISASCDSFGFAKIRGSARWSGLKSLVDILGAVACDMKATRPMQSGL
jgi:lysophospholipid acyltransferase (LPLAT)-like uncharacterized protein